MFRFIIIIERKIDPKNLKTTPNQTNRQQITAKKSSKHYLK